MSHIQITHTTQKIDQEVTLFGWIQTIRNHGKLSFIDLRDRTGVIQCVWDQTAKGLHPESVIKVQGKILKRQQELINDDLGTGKIELQISSLEVLNAAVAELPIPVKGDGLEINEEKRLEYRYLDLRRQRMRQTLELRSRFFAELRKVLESENFTEVETPMLTQSTREGSRDFLVPARLQPGKFYALPQSPQQYKQLLMTAGIEKYFQFARCIRDEDLRADRGFEFTQLDMEMSFVDRDQVLQTVENLVIKSVTAVGGKIKQQPFPVVSYNEAISKYGEDRFDLRTPEDKEQGVLAFAWVVNFPMFKKVDTQDAAEVRDGKSGVTFMHNPFCSPIPEHLEQHMAGTNPETITALQYDLVCNGYEVAGGSIRAHKPEVLEQTFKIMGYSDSEIEKGIGHMLRAFETGTPPHGGIALGLDRLVMLLSNQTSLKETIAFPMTKSGNTAVMQAPSPVSEQQLAELSIKSSAQMTASEKMYQVFESAAIGFEVQVTTDSEDFSTIKTLLLQSKKTKQRWQVVIPADKKLDTTAVSDITGHRMEFVSLDTLQAEYGVALGAVPALPIYDLPVIIDSQCLELEEVLLQGGTKASKIKLTSADFGKVWVNPTIAEVSSD